MKIKVLFSYVSLIFILSCGGGGGGDDNGGGVDEDDGINPSGEIINPGLEGKFFFVDYQNANFLDAETGKVTEMPNSYYQQQTERFPIANTTHFSVIPARNSNAELLVTAEHYPDSYVCMQSFTGTYHGQFHLSDSVLTGYLSQDLQYVVIFRRYGSVSNTPWLELFTRDGQRLDRREGFSKRQIIWLRDNRMLYSKDRTFYFTEPVSTEDQLGSALRLPDADTSDIGSGTIGNKALSPDETQLIFTVAESHGTRVHGAQMSRLYIMNIDGSNVRLLATTYNDVDPAITQVSWSPDGRWIFLNEGYHVSGNGWYDPRGTNYIIPTDNLNKVYYLSENESERSPEVRLFWRYPVGSETAEGITTSGSPFHFTWVPD